MKRPDGITPRSDLPGTCDVCTADMPTSAALVTAHAMRLLVEGGFDPIAKDSLTMRAMMAASAKFNIPESLSLTMMKRRYLSEEMGDFVVCSKCAQRITDFCD